MYSVGMVKFKDICTILAAVQCLNSGQSLAEVAASANVSKQQVNGWLQQGGFRKITGVDGKIKYVVG